MNPTFCKLSAVIFALTGAISCSKQARKGQQNNRIISGAKMSLDSAAQIQLKEVKVWPHTAGAKVAGSPTSDHWAAVNLGRVLLMERDVARLDQTVGSLLVGTPRFSADGKTLWIPPHQVDVAAAKLSEKPFKPGALAIGLGELEFTQGAQEQYEPQNLVTSANGNATVVTVGYRPSRNPTAADPKGIPSQRVLLIQPEKQTLAFDNALLGSCGQPLVAIGKRLAIVAGVVSSKTSRCIGVYSASWDSGLLKTVELQPSTEGFISAVAISSDDKVFAVGDRNGGFTLTVLEAAEAKSFSVKAAPAAQDAQMVTALAFAETARVLAVATRDRKVAFWRVASDPAVKLGEITTNDEVASVAWLNGDRSFVISSSGLNENALHLYDVVE